MQNTYSSDEIDKMKADAINRARQMRSRASITPILQKEDEPKSKKIESQKADYSPFSALSKMLNMESDQLILIALVLLLKGNRENLPIIIALLYIAM